jgi:hypothetical protein
VTVPPEPTLPELGDQPDMPPTEPAPPVEDVSGLTKALKAERELRKAADKRVKELTPFEQQVKDAEDAKKTEVQRATETLQAERDARSKAELALLRYEVGAVKGVPLKLVPFLSGVTREEVETAADTLLAELGPGLPAMPGRPTERMTNGQPSLGSLDQEDPMALIAMGRGQDTKR